MRDARPSAAPPALPAFVTDEGESCILTVRVIPRAGRTALAGTRGGALLVRLTAPPVEGAANEALVAFLSDRLSIQKDAVAIVSGTHRREKRVRVTGLGATAAAARIGNATND
jgi:uncharacterized protein (TIGR00251 family)